MNVCLDAGFLIGLYDERDQHHQTSSVLFTELFGDGSRPNVAVVVWPILYESVSTQLVKRRHRMIALEQDWRRLVATRRLEFLDDSLYREEALELCFQELQKPLVRYRDLSLTDRVLRGVLSDSDVRVDGIATFNEGDFVDVCRDAGRTIFNKPVS
ncbi:MAG TPA: hypothetical protein VN612_01680 [Acidobacteriaceae bacterium]|nr:hypothetical protein [Acidobacteriaceae bacterium]